MRRPQLARVIAALVESFQMDLVRKGRLAETDLLSAQSASRPPAAREDIVIGEGDLGLDSLDRLALVTVMNDFFGLSVTGIEDYLLIRRRLGDWLDLVQAHLDRVGGDAQFAFSTSGSTGKPRKALHPLALLRSELTAQIAGPLATTGAPARVVALVPPHHIYGFLWTVLLPDMLGLDVLDLSQAAPTALFREGRPGDLVVGTPFGWGRICDCGRPLPAGLIGVTSGAPCPDATWTALGQAGLTSVTEVYGASETGGIGWRTGPDAPFRLLDDIAITRRRLSRGGRRLRVQDRLGWCGDTTFRVLGRKDKVVQVAGKNVNLDGLRTRLLRETGATDAAVRLVEDRIACFIATPPQSEPQVRVALHALLRQLPAVERPASITFGAALPRTPMGKLASW